MNQDLEYQISKNRYQYVILTILKNSGTDGGDLRLSIVHSAP